MKTASNIFSWLGAIGSSIYSIIMWKEGKAIIAKPVLFWVVFVAVVIIRLIILCCRESEIESGHKVRCGVYTLLFVSVIGGILTLCIPEENKQYRSSGEMPPLERLSTITKYENELSNGEISMEEYKRKMAQLDGEPDEQYDPKKLTEEEKIRIIRQYKELLDENLITEEEYNKKKQEIL